MSWRDTLVNLLRLKRSGRLHGSGVDTQYRGVAENAQRQQLVIGLDFGTAFTKVVVSDSLRKYAIPLAEVDGLLAYLLPSAIWRSETGVYSISPSLGVRLTGLKMPLIEDELGPDEAVHVAVYLAYVLRRVRGFILGEKEEVYRNRRIDWYINAGIPTDTFHQSKRTNRYKEVIRAAWSLSTTSAPITESLARAVLEGGIPDADLEVIDSDAIALVPEFAAQVVGYVRSPLRQADLHLLVDVGAGTLDVTVFNVHDVEGEDKFPIFARAVESMGTHKLIQHRMDAVGENPEVDPFTNVPPRPNFAALLGVNEDDLADVDRGFKAKVVEAVSGRLTYTKQHRYPLSKAWETGVPTFACGGGAKCDVYTECLVKPERIGRFRTRPMRLPLPNDLDAPGLVPIDFDRLSVAYGLSFDKFDIGEVIPEFDIENVHDQNGQDATTARAGRSGTPGYICSRCNGTGGMLRPCNVCGGSGWGTPEPRVPQRS